LPPHIRARLLHNPRSAGGRFNERIARIAADAGLEIVRTADPDEMTAQAARAVEQGERMLFVAGGDGAMHHAIQALAGSECALALVPAGTGNDLARALGVPLDPARAVSRALGQRRRRIDLGRVAKRFFAGVAGIGLDGEVNRFLTERKRLLRGSAAYAWATLNCLRTFEPPRVRAEYDGGHLECRSIIAVVANSPFFGGGMRIAPQARIDDGLLDLVIVESLSIVRLFLLFPRVYRGTHIGHASVHGLRVRRTRLTCSRPLTVYADGEPICGVPEGGIQVEIRPDALWVV
jgi:diacylglycerol kinase (ATP)